MEGLAETDRKIIRMICEEYKQTKEIAAQLYLADRTIEGRRSRIMRATGCKNVLQLVADYHNQRLKGFNDASN